MWFDGFIEEHYVAGPRILIRLATFAYIILCIFAFAANIAVAVIGQGTAAAAILGVGIAAFMVATSAMVHQYRKQAESPQLKRMTVILMVINVVMCVAACMLFHLALNAPGTPATTTEAPNPWGPPTPAPPNTTSGLPPLAAR